VSLQLAPAAPHTVLPTWQRFAAVHAPSGTQAAPPSPTSLTTAASASAGASGFASGELASRETAPDGTQKPDESDVLQA
jgi:hypothetical protein